MSSDSAVMDRCQRQQENDTKNHRIWGDTMEKKSKYSIRVLFQNINGFGWKKEILYVLIL